MDGSFNISMSYFLLFFNKDIKAKLIQFLRLKKLGINVKKKRIKIDILLGSFNMYCIKLQCIKLFPYVILFKTLSIKSVVIYLTIFIFTSALSEKNRRVGKF